MLKSLCVSIIFFMVLFINPYGVESMEKEFVMSKNPVVVIETSQGEIEVALMPDVAPKACENMLHLAKNNYYDGMIFHRVIRDFMIQGGDPTGTGTGGESVWGHEFEDEVNEEVTFDGPGILAMANAGPGTNGSQFFITTVSTPWLHMHHTIFGKVVKGLGVVKEIESVDTNFDDKPIEDQTIVKVYLKEKVAAKTKG